MFVRYVKICKDTLYCKNYAERNNLIIYLIICAASISRNIKIYVLCTS